MGSLGGSPARTFLIDTVQVTVFPPPLPEPLHWLTVTWRAQVIVDGPTVHVTRITPPPPLPDPLHWVMVAFVVLAGVGSQFSVEPPPPPVPDPTHWFTVAAVAVNVPVMLLRIVTLQITLLPPPRPDPLH